MSACGASAEEEAPVDDHEPLDPEPPQVNVVDDDPEPLDRFGVKIQPFVNALLRVRDVERLDGEDTVISNPGPRQDTTFSNRSEKLGIESPQAVAGKVAAPTSAASNQTTDAKDRRITPEDKAVFMRDNPCPRRSAVLRTAEPGNLIPQRDENKINHEFERDERKQVVQPGRDRERGSRIETGGRDAERGSVRWTTRLG